MNPVPSGPQFRCFQAHLSVSPPHIPLNLLLPLFWLCRGNQTPDVLPARETEEAEGNQQPSGRNRTKEISISIFSFDFINPNSLFFNESITFLTLYGDCWLAYLSSQEILNGNMFLNNTYINKLQKMISDPI